MFFSKLRLNGTACLEKYHPKDPDIHQGVYMDIFPCDNAMESEFGRKCQFYASKVVIAKALDARGYDTDSRKKMLFMAACRLLPMKPFLNLAKGPRTGGTLVHSFLGGASSFGKNVYPRICFEQRTEGIFEGERHPISREYDKLLRILYGDYMRIPPPEERICKQHAILVDLERSWEDYRNYRDDMKFDVFTRSIR
jgi:lipopolysaccharide cholinephosphotransferase